MSFIKDKKKKVECDHGVKFDKVAAEKLLAESPVDPKMDPAVAFIMGPSNSGEVRKRWPRLSGPCPKGCGFNGIAYASYEHYIMGDW